jgi:hypothetical protein
MKVILRCATEADAKHAASLLTELGIWGSANQLVI